MFSGTKGNVINKLASFKKDQTMRHFYRHILILLFIMNCPYELYGQDTVIYRGFVNRILYESIDLYPDKTFKWTSEYDLSWSEYGFYEIDNNNLQLKYYISFNRPTTMSIKDSIMQIGKPIKIENFKLEKDLLYRLNRSGREIHRIKVKSIRTCWSWIFGYKYELKKIAVAKSQNKSATAFPQSSLRFHTLAFLPTLKLFYRNVIC